MAFMSLKTIVFHKKNTFHIPNFVPFIVCSLTGLVNNGPNVAIFLSWEVFKGTDITKTNDFKEFCMTLLSLTAVFHKKK